MISDADRVKEFLDEMFREEETENVPSRNTERQEAIDRAKRALKAEMTPHDNPAVNRFIGPK